MVHISHDVSKPMDNLGTLRQNDVVDVLVMVLGIL
jgi:hypothetical protein